MNIEIANRLLEFRKQNNLSQEELAEKIGISRQAVSKWECAESSPDLDNLIELAKLYNVTLDELLFTGAKKKYDEKNDEEKEYVSIGWNGIHVKDKDGTEVRIGGRGHSVVVDGKRTWASFWHCFPFWSLVTIAYLLMGFIWNLWHPGWIVWLTIPLYHFIIEAVFGKDPNHDDDCDDDD